MVVYKVTNIQNHKIYIGYTKNLDYRKLNHIRDSKYGSQLYFHRAIRKYGSQNFKWEILGYCETNNEANEIEKICIEFFKSNDKRYGYNMTSGGDGSDGFKGRVHSSETKLKISKANSGKIRTIDHKLNYSLSHIGLKHSNETKLKLSLKFKGRKSPSKGIKRGQFSEDHKKKLSIAKSGKNNINYRHDLDNNIDLIKQLKSEGWTYALIAKKFNCSINAIYERMN